jgi:hypothetical protein
VGRNISGVGGRGTVGYRRKWQGILQALKAGDALDRGAFWLSDKCWIIAVIIAMIKSLCFLI